MMSYLARITAKTSVFRFAQEQHVPNPCCPVRKSACLYLWSNRSQLGSQEAAPGGGLCCNTEQGHRGSERLPVEGEAWEEGPLGLHGKALGILALHNVPPHLAVTRELQSFNKQERDTTAAVLSFLRQELPHPRQFPEGAQGDAWWFPAQQKAGAEDHAVPRAGLCCRTPHLLAYPAA